MDLEVIFKRLGFGKNAHAIYAALYKSKKPLLISEIAGKARIDRPEVYRNIKKLITNRLVKSTREGKRTLFSAESPDKISSLFKIVSRDADSLATSLAKKEKELPQHVRYFKGFQGIRAVFDDVIEKTPRGATFYRYTSERDVSSVNRYLSKNYRARRDKKKLERLVISNPASGSQKRMRLERFIKYIPQEVDLFDQNIIQLVYSDSVAFINLNTEEAFVIKDKSLADFQTVIFKQLYKKL